MTPLILMVVLKTSALEYGIRGVTPGDFELFTVVMIALVLVCLMAFPRISGMIRRSERLHRWSGPAPMMRLSAGLGHRRPPAPGR